MRKSELYQEKGRDSICFAPGFGLIGLEPDERVGLLNAMNRQ
jgi:hypothetical protein